MSLLHGAITPPAFAAAPLNAAMRGLLSPGDSKPFDFTVPEGEPALAAPDSVSWRIFKNPVSLFVGGVAAVILELAEPRVRTGVWEHSSFRTRPAHRLSRTGLAAMITVYGPRSEAERMIAGVRRAHERVRGHTPDGAAYAANDEDLLNWVQATAGFGFLEAYRRFVAPVAPEDADKAYAEARPAARLYGALGAPTSEAELEAMFAAWACRLERSDIVFEFLSLMRSAPVLPAPLRPMQRLMVRAAADMTPLWAREILGLGPDWDLAPWQGALLRRAGAAADRLVLGASPAVQACRRLGLPDDWLFRGRD